MKRLFFFLIILAVAVLIGIQIKLNPGYVLISTKHVAIETRLWFAIVCLVAAFYVMYFLIRFLKATYSVPSRWRHWRQHEKLLQATKQTNQGFMELAQGEWGVAQKHLMKQVKYASAPALNYLAAEIAAGRDDDVEQRDHYLQLAANAAPKAHLAIGLVQAQLQYDAGQYEMALASLHAINRHVPRHKHVLALYAKLYKKLAEWTQLANALSLAEQYNALPEKQLMSMAALAYQHVFCEINNVLDLKAAWQAAPKAIRQQTEIVFLYIKALNRLGEVEEADKLTRHILKEDWSSALAGYYQQIELSNSKKQLAHAESWLKSHSNDPQALFSAARLAERTKLWGKAKDYYRASLESAANPEVYAAFANLLEEQGDVRESLVYYRKGLKASY